MPPHQRKAAKRAISSASKVKDDSGSKRRRTNKRAVALDDSDTDSDSSVVHHRWPVERKSDLVISLRGRDKSRTRHEYHVHQQTLAKSCIYFASLIDNPDNEQRMVIELPDAFTWTVQELKQWLDICYNQYDEMLNKLAHTHTKQALVELVFRKGATMGIIEEPTAKPQWTVTGHADTGVELLNSADKRKLTAVLPADCTLRSGLATFSELAESMNLLEMFAISTYFQHQQVSDLLSAVLLVFVQLGSISVSLIAATVCDTLPATQVRAACIARLLRCTSFVENDLQSLTRLPPRFLADVYLASAKEKLTTGSTESSPA